MVQTRRSIRRQAIIYAIAINFQLPKGPIPNDQAPTTDSMTRKRPTTDSSDQGSGWAPPVGRNTSDRGDAKPIARPGVSPIEGTRRELDHGEATPRPRDPPGGHVATELQYFPGPRDERHINRETHEKGVDRVGWGNDERRVG